MLSSMEVYGEVDCPDDHKVTETEAAFGRLEPLRNRSCYPMAKRMAENIYYCYYGEYGVPVKIARLSQTFGAGVLPSDGRVFVQFARAAVRSENIVLHTKGESMGNYCGIKDAVAGMETCTDIGGYVP